MMTIYSLNPAIEEAINALYQMVTPYLLDKTVQEVSANWDAGAKVTKVYVDHGAGNMEFVGEIDPHAIVAATLMLATEVGKSIDINAAFLNCVLPIGCRYHAAMPPVTDGPSFSIRLHHPREWKLSDFGMKEEQIAEISNAVLNRMTILVAGGTFVGKTSYLNALLKLIPVEERLLVVEDEMELHVREGNVVRRRATEMANLKRQVFEALRDRPDRIIVGEVRSVEAADMLDALATGHAGGLSTIHANSVEGAIKRLQRLAQCDLELINEAINVIIFLERRGKQRNVKEIQYL
jgi:type IV secretion system protein TrbB